VSPNGASSSRHLRRLARHAHGYGMNATCEKCRHRADLDMQALIAKFGDRFCYIGANFNRRFVCGRCGAREVGVQIHPLHSGQSRFAD
jgi:hypothetical protein